MATRKCKYYICYKPFIVTNGNQWYCPDKNCAMLAKLDKQKSLYKIGDDAKKAIQKNHKIFLELLGSSTSKEIELTDILKKGFDQYGYFGTYAKENGWSYRVNNYHFEIDAIIKPTKIKIWKE